MIQYSEYGNFGTWFALEKIYGTQIHLIKHWVCKVALVLLWMTVGKFQELAVPNVVDQQDEIGEDEQKMNQIDVANVMKKISGKGKHEVTYCRDEVGCRQVKNYKNVVDC